MARRSRTLLLAVVACSIHACVRPSSPSASGIIGVADSARAPQSAVETLRAAEQAWAQALRRRDYPTLERLLAPEFRLVSRGRVTSRAEWLRNLHTFRVDSVALFDVVPRVVGDSGIVSLELYWRAEVEGAAPINRTGVLRDTWRRRDGRWVVVERETLLNRPGYAPSASLPRR